MQADLVSPRKSVETTMSVVYPRMPFRGPASLAALSTWKSVSQSNTPKYRLQYYRADLVIGGWLLQTNCQVDDGDVRGGNTERHPSQLSIQLRDHLAHRLGCSGGGRDDVLRCATSTTPVFPTGAVHRLLGGSGGVHGGHQAFGDLEVVVDHFGKRGKTVGGAGGVRDNLHAALVLVVVHTHHEHWGIGRGGRDYHLQ